MKRVAFVLAFLVSSAAADLSGGTGGYAAAFLQIPVYPRAVAMGNAFAALADDPSAVFWNPAGIAEFEMRSFTVSYSKLTLDRSHSFGVIALPFGEAYNCVAIAFNNFSVKNIDKRDAQGNPMGSFNDSESAIMLALATSFFASEDGDIIVDLGFSTKFILHSFDDAQAKGFSMDLGFIADFYRTYRFGLALYDPFGKLWWNTGTSEEIPQRLTAGFAIAPRQLPFRLELDASYNLKSEGFSLYGGAELKIAKVLSLRAGYSSRLQKPSFGLGVSIDKLSLDYAFTEDQLEPRPSHHIGLIFKF